MSCGLRSHADNFDDSKANPTRLETPMLRLVQLVLAAALLAAAMPAARAQDKGDVGEMFNPYLAEKNLEVGQFYLKKKNYDAAIERFQESIKYKSNFAKPHLLLGLCYEKKGDLEDAVEYYEKYLKILPSADDAEDVRKRIEKLKAQIEKKKKRRRSG
jgi:tetratricopeptide (TPR) repeat protein